MITPQELFEKYSIKTSSKDILQKNLMTEDQFIAALAELTCCGQVKPDVRREITELLETILITVQAWNHNFPLSGAESMQQRIQDYLIDACPDCDEDGFIDRPVEFSSGVVYDAPVKCDHSA